MSYYIPLVFITLLLPSSVSTAKPQVSVEVRNGHFSDIEGLDPKLTWKYSGESGDYDLQVRTILIGLYLLIAFICTPFTYIYILN